MPPNTGTLEKGVGEKAFDHELDRLLEHIMVRGGGTPAGDVTEAIARVGEAAAAANYLGALRLLGDVEISLEGAQALPEDGAVQPEDVEQALGDLRRAIARWESGEAREVATALCHAARVAAAERRWAAAWALIEEADERLADRGK